MYILINTISFTSHLFSGEIFEETDLSRSFREYRRVQTQFHRRASATVQGTYIRSL